MLQAFRVDFSKSLKSQMLAFLYRKYILNVNLQYRQMCISLLEQRAPIHSILDPSPLTKNFLFVLANLGEFHLKELNMNAVELLLHPNSFFINKAI